MLSHQRSCIWWERNVIGLIGFVIAVVIIAIAIICRRTRSIVVVMVGLAGRMVQPGQGFLVPERVDRGRRIDQGLARTAIQLWISILAIGVRRDASSVAQVQARSGIASIVGSFAGIVTRLLAEHLEWFCSAPLYFYFTTGLSFVRVSLPRLVVRR